MKVCLVGEGAQGVTHIDTLRKFNDVEVVTLAGGIRADAEAFGREHGIFQRPYGSPRAPARWPTCDGEVL